MLWFETLLGFREETPEQVRENIKVVGNKLISKVNGREIYFGELEIPTLGALAEKVDLSKFRHQIKISEVVANVYELHLYKNNENSLFQVASQFNLLEMIHQGITPEMGVGQYEYDRTQGPICAMACGGGTIFRNYFVNLNGQIGQTEHKQIDCLELVGKVLENPHFNFWKMKNGYALFSEEGILAINQKLSKLSQSQLDEIKNQLKIGIQWNTEVVLSENKHRVSQVYCSALPISYNHLDFYYFEAFARLILEATYEATLYAGLLNMMKYKSPIVYLTLIGGGAFGNEENWILDSMKKALKKFAHTPLDIRIVSYQKSNPEIVKMIKEF